MGYFVVALQNLCDFGAVDVVLIKNFNEGFICISTLVVVGDLFEEGGQWMKVADSLDDVGFVVQDELHVLQL